ncbi:zinc transporter ZupT [Serpentinicella alkaliphila]|uniref:Zinc transporter ZupT n=1 Tax=Serpentinicella alkaliphila TaxID=1734049 RepID=A0A4R2T2Q1_9FIRM|nr:zinc transporter ZupT [Serpentinicella alkaliphila]QUH25870.1 zinc transporter ZupT [Serpentinicella alkaliphila]TCP97189.1 ZIP family zinc transporter [Serpentinicella alkaliphila]
MEGGGLLFAFSLTLLAGLSTGLGSAIALFTKKTNKKFLSLSLGLSAGVMIYVSMIEIFFKAQESLTSELGTVLGSWVTIISFFGGMLFIALIDKFIPGFEGTPEEKNSESITVAEEVAEDKSRLMRMGVFTALAVAIHNFPEGFATLISALQDPTLGISIAIAIAIHNIPEGIAVSIPIYYATGDKLKAFKYSFLSGIAEPIGALVGYLILAPFMSETIFGIIFAAVGGIMVFISLDQLLPAARDYGDHHLSVYGTVIGMIIMAISLVLLA